MRVSPKWGLVGIAITPNFKKHLVLIRYGDFYFISWRKSELSRCWRGTESPLFLTVWLNGRRSFLALKDGASWFLKGNGVPLGSFLDELRKPEVSFGGFRVRRPLLFFLLWGFSWRVRKRYCNSLRSHVLSVGNT